MVITWDRSTASQTYRVKEYRSRPNVRCDGAVPSELCDRSTLGAYGRFEDVHFNGQEFAANTQTNVEIATGGVNYYLCRQAAKISFDINYSQQFTGWR
jgi:YHS domain-containing protein